jgi:ketosteroid isomerase-like protein
MEIPAQSLTAHRIPREQKERTMKRMLIIALPLLLPCLTLGQTQEKKEKAKPVNGGSVEQAVLKLEEETVGAIQKGDCAFIEKNFSDDYINITSNGQMTTKAELVNACKSGQIKYDTYDLKKDRKVRVYGNTAIVISEDEVKGHFGSVVVSGPRRRTLVFVKNKGQWQLVTFQATPEQ